VVFKRRCDEVNCSQGKLGLSLKVKTEMYAKHPTQ